MLAVDDLAPCVSLQPKGELFSHAIAVGSDPPRRDDAAALEFDPATSRRPAVFFMSAEGFQVGLTT